jgi:solute:Na+ symporter, SSS family
MSAVSLRAEDFAVFAAYFAGLSAIGLWVGRRRKERSEDYFLAGRDLPWYVVGTSFIGSNISTEHFIGMVGAAFIFGVSVAMAEWGNVLSFSLLIWFFVPFLLAAKVFTIPEFLERRFNFTIRVWFAVVTVISNVVAFLASVLYGGGLALQALFGWDLWFGIIALGVVAGAWAIYGGLRSVAWTDFFTVIVMLAGGMTVTILGLQALSGDNQSVTEGFWVMVERNRAADGVWRDAVEQNADAIVRASEYNRLSVVQPATHRTDPWPNLLFSFLTVSIWYNVINQFMIQRVLAARDVYHARMGVVLAGYLKIVMPAVVVMPGLIFFAMQPELMLLPWEEIRPEADKGYVTLIQTLVPAGLTGLFLAALFGAIQSTVNSVINSTATILTLDLYKRILRPTAPERHYVLVGIGTSAAVMTVSILLAPTIGFTGHGLFVYIQTLYAFFAPPFSSVFLWGIFFKRINATGATVAVAGGFLFGIGLKLYVEFVPDHVQWLEPYSMQALANWVVCSVICVSVSLATARPAPEKVTDDITFNWEKISLREDLGNRWYKHVFFWWLLFVLIVLILVVLLSPLGPFRR